MDSSSASEGQNEEVQHQHRVSWNPQAQWNGPVVSQHAPQWPHSDTLKHIRSARMHISVRESAYCRKKITTIIRNRSAATLLSANILGQLEMSTHTQSPFPQLQARLHCFLDPPEQHSEPTAICTVSAAAWPALVKVLPAFFQSIILCIWNSHWNSLWPHRDACLGNQVISYVQTTIFIGLLVKDLEWLASNPIFTYKPYYLYCSILQNTRFFRNARWWAPVCTASHLLGCTFNTGHCSWTQFHMGFSCLLWPCLSLSMHCLSPHDHHRALWCSAVGCLYKYTWHSLMCNPGGKGNTKLCGNPLPMLGGSWWMKTYKQFSLLSLDWSVWGIFCRAPQKPSAMETQCSIPMLQKSLCSGVPIVAHW